jgi:nitric oxide reductase NorD protein
VAHHWAQTRYGTWHESVLDDLLARSDQSQVWTVFVGLERLRLDAIIARELPGLYRSMQALGSEPELQGTWQGAAKQLRQPQASVETSVALIPQIADEPPPAAVYHGVFNPRQVQLKQQARIRRERDQLRLLAGKLQQQLNEEEDFSGNADKQPRQRKPSEGFTLVQGEPGQSGRIVFQLQLAEQHIDIPDSMRELLNSIYQDLGQVPEEYLQGIGRRLYDAEQSQPSAAVTYATGGLDGADKLLRLPEWDHTRQRFRPDYCTLREYTITPQQAAEGVDFVTATRRKHHNLLKSIRRSFEVLLGAERLERRQLDGDDIDLDALVQARVDAQQGEEMSAAVYTRLRHNARSIAVVFMVDMSGSTKGWVNQAEREALVLLCEALETIGDRYAIYGFSGRTHQRVDVYRIKTFDERFTTVVKGRIAAIQPRAYTRLGAPIRYLGGLLQQQPARHKLLITLSDGKPEDYGSYYGRYGIEDTRHALLELRRDGVYPFCITIDKEGGDYLPHMYGPANYALIDEVPKLPLKVADIYRKLTT